MWWKRRNKPSSVVGLMVSLHIPSESQTVCCYFSAPLTSFSSCLFPNQQPYKHCTPIEPLQSAGMGYTLDTSSSQGSHMRVFGLWGEQTWREQKSLWSQGIPAGSEYSACPLSLKWNKQKRKTHFWLKSIPNFTSNWQKVRKRGNCQLNSQNCE